MVDEKILEAREKIKQKVKDKLANGEQYVYSKKEALIMVCDTVEEVEKIWKYQVLEEKMEEGTLDRDDLQTICDDVFGKDNEMGRRVFLGFIKNGKINDKLTNEEDLEYKELEKKHPIKKSR